MLACGCVLLKISLYHCCAKWLGHTTALLSAPHNHTVLIQMMVRLVLLYCCIPRVAAVLKRSASSGALSMSVTSKESTLMLGSGGLASINPITAITRHRLNINVKRSGVGSIPSIVLPSPISSANTPPAFRVRSRPSSNNTLTKLCCLVCVIGDFVVRDWEVFLHVKQQVSPLFMPWYHISVVKLCQHGIRKILSFNDWVMVM